MKGNFIQNLKSKVLRALESVGNLINQIPTSEENRKAYSTVRGGQQYPQKKKSASPSKEKKKLSKEVYDHKGSGYKGKGKINTDTHTFNQPRKGGAAGKSRSSH